MGPGHHPQCTRADYGQEAVGGSLTTSTAQTSDEPTTPKLIQHGSGASVRPGRERAASVLLVAQVLRRVKTRPLETHCEASENFPRPSLQKCRRLPHAHMRTARNVRSMVSVRTVVVVILDSGSRTSTENDCGDCSVVRAMETTCV